VQNRVISFLNQSIQPPTGVRYKYNVAVEQYRGLCALMVMACHGIVATNMLFTNGFKWPGFADYIGAGYLSVIIFFCISGYVIGLTNNHQSFNIWQYLKKRMVRLYPIYLVSIVLCIVIAGGVSLYVLLGNLFFLQNDLPYYHFHVPIFINYATWSLNNEALYYLLFILIIYLRPKIWQLLLLLMVGSLLMIHTGNSFLFLGGYINGFYFWMLGLLIGWNIIKGDDNISVKPIPLLSLMFLHMCQHHLGVGQMILHTIGIYTSSDLNWLGDIPFSLMIMTTLTGRDNAFLRYNKILCYLTPAAVFIFLLAHHRIFEDVRWVMCLIYWVLSLAFYFEKKISAFIADKLTGVGKISYALYLMHVPVALLIKKFVFINNPQLEIAVKYMLWIGITFSLSILLERYLQPAIKKALTANA